MLWLYLKYCQLLCDLTRHTLAIAYDFLLLLDGHCYKIFDQIHISMVSGNNILEPSIPITRIPLYNLMLSSLYITSTTAF